MTFKVMTTSAVGPTLKTAGILVVFVFAVPLLFFVLPSYFFSQ